jgi:hypothetical protein
VSNKRQIKSFWWLPDQTDEGAHDLHAGLFGAFTTQDVRQHERAVLGKGVGQVRRKLDPCKLVTTLPHSEPYSEQFLKFIPGCARIKLGSEKSLRF